MRGFLPVFKREFSAYFATALAYVFTVIFLLLCGIFTFYLGRFYERGQADLFAFFDFIPWLYLILAPAVSMGLWSEERRSGTFELLSTLPISLGGAVLGKFLAAWCFVGLALLLTFPLWLTVNYLGSPDNGVILVGYLASFLLAGNFLAIGSCLSAASKSQVVAFILSLVICFFFVILASPMIQDFLSGWFPRWALETFNTLGVYTHFNSLVRGVIDLRDVLYFCLMIVGWLFATVVVLNLDRK